MHFQSIVIDRSGHTLEEAILRDGPRSCGEGNNLDSATTRNYRLDVARYTSQLHISDAMVARNIGSSWYKLWNLRRRARNVSEPAKCKRSQCCSSRFPLVVRVNRNHVSFRCSFELLFAQLRSSNAPADRVSTLSISRTSNNRTWQISGNAGLRLLAHSLSPWGSPRTLNHSRND